MNPSKNPQSRAAKQVGSVGSGLPSLIFDHLLRIVKVRPHQIYQGDVFGDSPRSARVNPVRARSLALLSFGLVRRDFGTIYRRWLFHKVSLNAGNYWKASPIARLIRDDTSVAESVRSLAASAVHQLPANWDRWGNTPPPLKHHPFTRS